MSEEIEFNFRQPDTSGLLPEPSLELIEWLKRCVLQEGGALVNAVCRPKVIDYPSATGRGFQGQTQACGHDALALVPYQTKDGEDAEAKVCLVCDGAVAWPRLDPGPVEPEEPEPFQYGGG